MNKIYKFTAITMLIVLFAIGLILAMSVNTAGTKDLFIIFLATKLFGLGMTVFAYNRLVKLGFLAYLSEIG